MVVRLSSPMSGPVQWWPRKRYAVIAAPLGLPMRVVHQADTLGEADDLRRWRLALLPDSPVHVVDTQHRTLLPIEDPMSEVPR